MVHPVAVHIVSATPAIKDSLWVLLKPEDARVLMASE
jgi:hypothetical protein